MWHKSVLIAIALSFVGLVVHRVGYYYSADPGSHKHPPGAHAGALVSLGNDRYHVEAVFTSDGRLKLYTLDSDVSRILEVEGRTFTAYLTPQGETQARAMTLQPEPQSGDSSASTSCFSGSVPTELVGKSMGVSIPNFSIGKQRFHIAFVLRAEREPLMPPPVAESEERRLHLVPGGKYTGRDIVANGRAVPSRKYRAFQAQHDHDPQPGDQLCPVSRTKANPACTWVVDGQTYQFCCPPCIDEFVRLAKEQPEQAKPPDAYVQQ